MNTAKNYTDKLNEIRNLIIEDIKEHLLNAKANEVELTGHSIVVCEIDDQFSQTIDRVSNEGVTVAISFGEEENWNFEDLSNNSLLSVLEKFDTNNFEVYEESAEQGS